MDLRRWVARAAAIAWTIWTGAALPAGADEPRRIGVLASLSGDFALFGQDVRKGAELAAKELGRQGKPVELFFEDDKCLPKDGVSAFRKLTEVDRIELLVGPGCTGVISSIGPLAQAKGLPVVALLDANDVTKKAGATTFIIGFDAADLADIVGREMIRRGLTRAAVLYESDAWAEFVRESFAKRYTAAGGSVLKEAEQKVGDADYRPALTSLLAAKPQALYVIPAYHGGRIFQQARRMGIKVPFFGPDTLGNAAALETAPSEAEGAVFANIVLDESSERAARMLAALRAEAGATKLDSPFYAALGYDAVHLGYKALSSGKPPVEALRDAECDCVTPMKRFDSERLAKIAPVLLEIRAGKAEPVAR